MEFVDHYDNFSDDLDRMSLLMIEATIHEQQDQNNRHEYIEFHYP